VKNFTGLIEEKPNQVHLKTWLHLSIRMVLFPGKV